MKFNLELFATDKDAKKVLSSSDDKTVGDITLHYISGPEIDLSWDFQTKRF